MTMWEYQNIKIFFAKCYLPNCSKEVFCWRHMLLANLRVRKLLKHFIKRIGKDTPNLVQNRKKLLKENKKDYKSNGGVKIIDLIFGLIKKILLCENELILTLWS